jgi:hypothetical protein
LFVSIRLTPGSSHSFQTSIDSNLNFSLFLKHDVLFLLQLLVPLPLPLPLPLLRPRRRGCLEQMKHSFQRDHHLNRRPVSSSP